MKETITPGRWRGLMTTSNAEQVFTILAFDQRGSYRRMLPDDTPYADAVALKRRVIRTLSPHASAVLLDPVYGLMPAMDVAGTSGLLMAYEKSGYTGDSTHRKMEFDENWTIAKIKRMGASAVKLLVYYHPEAGELTDSNEMLIAEVCREVHAYDLPVFVEPVSYSLDPDMPKQSEAFAESRPEVVRETARRLSRLGPDVLKMEFPVDAAFDDDRGRWAEACQALTEACVVPWVLLSAGVDYDVFEQQVAVACKAGASGFLAGRAIWKEVVPTPEDERDAFLAGVATPRINKLAEIASRDARPWPAFYTPLDVQEGWYAAYKTLPGESG